MAAELLGGAFLSSFLQVAFDRLASREVLEFFRGRNLDEKLPKRLKNMLQFISPVVDDAELKQFSNPSVKAWLDAVRDAVLNAEDLLDEIDIQVTNCKPVAESQSFHRKVWDFLAPSPASPFDREIESMMKQVLEDLDDLQKQKDDLGLKNASIANVELGSKVLPKLQSTSLVAESVIYDRDHDIDLIINWLTENNNQLSIICILGMGGLGKTTLAQHVYNDSRMEEAKFDIKAWVCVSDEFDVFKVSKTILETIAKSKDDSGALEMVHGRLKKKLDKKRFFLVLDDVWNENPNKWKAVETPLNCGVQGSKVLVTTRSEKVAKAMRSNKVHSLKQLQEEQGWKIVAKHAFNDENPPFINPEFKEIGMELVKKCKGLPLALRTIGSLLYTKSSVLEWKSILRSGIWNLPEEHNNIIPALLLSYHHLPSALKRCFALCALFPKDYKFDKEDLILLWIAENFLECPQQSKSMEEVGAQYFDDLLSRSFFQQSSEDTTVYVMHDLLNDLAKYVCRDFCFMLDVEKALPSKFEKTRHFSFHPNGIFNPGGFGGLYEASRLRTFLPFRDGLSFMPAWKCGTSIHDLFSKFRFLRVLSLSYELNLREVPDSLCNLKHLRSLDLSYTNITKLPDSTCSLYNLQILRLRSCLSLTELPLNLHKLTKLRHLDLRKTKLRKKPMHLGELENLQVLMSSFHVDNGSDFKIQDLGELNLCGDLIISGMPSNVNPSDAKAANFKSKVHLVKLELEWKWSEDHEKENDVLEELQPSKYLKDLSIVYYGGTKFPSWFGHDSLSNLVSLKLLNCQNCALLPSLGMLPFLETFVLQNLMEWEKWECEPVRGAFPRLRELSIVNCPKLKEHLPDQLPCLMILSIRNCKQLVAALPWAPVLQELELWSCGKMLMDYNPSFMEGSPPERVGPTISYASLVSLSLYDCPNINFPFHHCHNSLVHLEIMTSCDSLTTFPLDFFPKLRDLDFECHNLQMISQDHIHNHLLRLRISRCPQLKSMPERMNTLLPSLTRLSVHSCPQVESWSDGGLPSSLEYLTLWNCPKIMASLRGALEANASLHTLSLGEVDVESFPDEGLLPLSVTSLEIYNCPNLKKLDYKGLCHLSSLKSLILVNCPSLQCLPEEGLPKSISNLRIQGNCPMLKQRCQKPNGEDWGKIAQIKNLKI